MGRDSERLAAIALAVSLDSTDNAVVSGPCSTWVTGADIAACHDPEASDPTVYDDWGIIASMVLFELSGRRYAGTCSRDVRPCRSDCACAWPGYGYGIPVGSVWDGGWWRYPSGACGCGVQSRVKLAGYPVRQVQIVTVDGEVIDPDTYRLDEHRYLTRLTGNGGWPSCQDQSLPSGAAGTFVVTYTYGADPPEVGRQAAIQLAWALSKTCGEGDDCALPSSVVNVVRQGLAYQRDPKNSTLGTGGSMNLVDLFLATYNPSGRRRRPAVMGRDVQQFARKVG